MQQWSSRASRRRAASLPWLWRIPALLAPVEFLRLAPAGGLPPLALAGGLPPLAPAISLASRRRTPTRGRTFPPVKLPRVTPAGGLPQLAPTGLPRLAPLLL